MEIIASGLNIPPRGVLPALEKETNVFFTLVSCENDYNSNIKYKSY